MIFIQVDFKRDEIMKVVVGRKNPWEMMKNFGFCSLS